jgi:RNA polymerase subunit RPABC4/transcription elongation factor Spt4
MQDTTNRGRFDMRVTALIVLIGLAMVVLPVLFLIPGLGLMRIHSGGTFVELHGLGGMTRVTSLLALVGLWGLIQIGLAVWVALDANRRGSNGLLWGLLVLVTPIIGLLVYLIMAPSLSHRNGVANGAPRAAAVAEARRCRECSAEVEGDFKVCPYCGAAQTCAQCGKAIRAGWKVCPYCATAIGGPTAS